MFIIPVKAFMEFTATSIIIYLVNKYCRSIFGLSNNQKLNNMNNQALKFERGQLVIVTLTMNTDGRTGATNGVIVTPSSGNGQLVAYDGAEKYKDVNELSTIDIIETITKGTKTISIVRMVKTGTNRVFFYPITSDFKRLNTVRYARKYDAVSLGKIYLNN